MRVRYDTVEFTEMVTETTRNWGGTRNSGEWCRHVRRVKIAEVWDYPGEGGHLDGALYRLGQRAAYRPVTA